LSGDDIRHIALQAARYRLKNCSEPSDRNAIVHIKLFRTIVNTWMKDFCARELVQPYLEIYTRYPDMTQADAVAEARAGLGK
jgi:hypothetical protein